MNASAHEEFLYELFSEGTDIPGYYRLKRCLIDFEAIKASVSSVLDAGCGSGAKCIYLARYNPALEIVGIDINQGALDHAEYLRIKRELPNVRFSTKDLAGTVDQKTFDLVIVSDVLEHIENDRRFAANADSMLSPGGFVHISVPSCEHDYDFSTLTPPEQGDVRQWMRDIGHVRLGYTPDGLTSLFPGYEVIKMKRVGNCCCKLAYFFWEKSIFDPQRKKPAELKREYTFPFVEFIDLLIHKYLVKDKTPSPPDCRSMNKRMFLQAIRTIDLGIEWENKGRLDNRYLIEEEICCLLRKPL
ncbi:MAG: class I SAM-dependent methyltransferase [Candidatus Aureabacteria bacterium]|nr:class I SAM-dependent methyltransferase [Candidatus Auribacterota bacterium]